MGGKSDLKRGYVQFLLTSVFKITLSASRTLRLVSTYITKSNFFFQGTLIDCFGLTPLHSLCVLKRNKAAWTMIKTDSHEVRFRVSDSQRGSPTPSLAALHFLNPLISPPFADLFKSSPLPLVANENS